MHGLAGMRASSCDPAHVLASHSSFIGGCECCCACGGQEAVEDRLLELRGREPAAVNSGADEQPAGASGPPVSHLVPSRLHGLQLPAVQALGLSATRCQPAASGHDLWCLALLPTRIRVAAHT